MKKKVIIEAVPKAKQGKKVRKNYPDYQQMFGDVNTVGISDEIYYTPTEKVKKQKPTTSFKMGFPNIVPTVGNPYLQKSLMNFNDALRYIPLIDPKNKVEDLPPPTYNPYANIYWNYEYGGNIPLMQVGGRRPPFTDEYGNQIPQDWGNNIQPNMFVDYLNRQNNDPNYMPDIQERPQQTFEKIQPLTAQQSLPNGQLSTNPVKLDFEKEATKEATKEDSQQGNPFQTAGAIAGTVAKIGTGTVNAIKGGAEIVASTIANKNEDFLKNQLYTQSVFSDAMNVTPYETQGYGFQGRNALAADGMQIREIGGKGEPNVEVEGEEHIQLPNGFSQEIKGKKHSEGGIPINLPQGTKIFSEKLKDPATKKSYADLAKKFETKKYVDLLNSKDADPIQRATAEMMVKQRNQKLEELFALQEKNKLSGAHGEQVQFNAMQEQQEAMAQEQEPMMMHGGLHKAQAGKIVTYPGGKTPLGKTTPLSKEFNAFNYPGGITQYIEDWKKGGLDISNLDPESAIQTATYKELLKTPKGREEIRNMWKKGNTALGISKGIGKGFDFTNLTDAQLEQLLPAYADNLLGVRSLKPLTETQTAKTSPEIKEVIKEVKVPEIQYKDNVVNKTYEVPGLNLGVALPNVYERLPLNYYKIQPNFIDPRYLDIQPQLNRIGRGQRAIESTLGSRGASDMANLLQAQANRAAAEQEAFGTKYNYDRAQDAAAQQFNAQAKTQADQYNQQSWYQQLEDPIRRRESLIGTQQMMDEQAAIENARKMQAFYGNKDFIGDTFFPAQAWGTDYALSELNKESYEKGYEEGKKEKNKKYGGKIKIKPKLKK